MTRSLTDLIFHPVRIRLLIQLNRHSPATTAQLVALLPDVTQRTLYRHLEELLEGGVIRVAKTQRIRGTVERHYELTRPAVVDPEEMRDLTSDDWQQLFLFLTSLLQAEFSAFVEERYGSDGLPETYVRLGEIVATPQQIQSFINETVARATALEESALEESAPENGEGETYRLGLIAFPLPKSLS